ncbi:hypothetical protein MKX01_007892 [Papaver californicum]|nr:hypothetical protein MKX01_007892 [Papaver californicum]
MKVYLNVDGRNYSVCSTSSSSSEVSVPLSHATRRLHRYIIKCEKTYSNLLISFLTEIANTIFLVVFIVFAAILKIAILIAVACTISYRKLHHRQTTRTANTTSILSLGEQEASGGVRLSLNDLQNLSSFKYEMVEPTQDCIVCLERLIKGERCRSLPRCKHVFHANCVDSWLIQVPSCPFCRQIIDKPRVNQSLPTD